MIVEDKAWIGNFIPLFNMDVIAYSCHNPNAGLAYFCW